MGTQMPACSDRTRTNWTPAMECYFIDLLLDQVHRRNRMGHTFNKQAWTDMLTMFNAYFGSPYDEKVLKSHYTNLWTQFNDVKSLLDQNGFSGDDTKTNGGCQSSCLGCLHQGALVLLMFRFDLHLWCHSEW